MFEKLVVCAVKAPTIESNLYSGSRTPTIGSDLDSGSQTTTTCSDLKENVRGNLQIVEGTIVLKECQALQIAIYVGVQQ